jgi:hypothetical protein
MPSWSLLLACLALAAPGGVQGSPDDGKIAPDIKADKLWDGRKMIPFRGLDIARMVPAEAADFLDENDYVLGFTMNGESRAYPTRFVWWHHVVNDVVHGPDGKDIPVAVTLCSVCNTGIRYDPVVNGRRLHFEVYGLYNGTVVLYDRETGSVWLQGEGRAVKGPLTGAVMSQHPLLDTTWAEWKRLHPDTLVMAPDSEYARFYNKKGQPEPRGYPRFPMKPFPDSMTRMDDRLPSFSLVLGVAMPGKGGGAATLRAYPLAALKSGPSVVNDSLAGEDIGVLYDPVGNTATAVSRKVGKRTVTLTAKRERNGSLKYQDKETGSTWSIEGTATAGPLAGTSLTRLNAHLSQWYGWSASFPDTSIYGVK